MIQKYIIQRELPKELGTELVFQCRNLEITALKKNGH